VLLIPVSIFIFASGLRYRFVLMARAFGIIMECFYPAIGAAQFVRGGRGALRSMVLRREL
jgi:hypothetical protein